MVQYSVISSRRPTDELRTVLPQLAQVGAEPQRLVEDEQGKVLGHVVVLQQLGGAPFELVQRGHVGTRLVDGM